MPVRFPPRQAFLAGRPIPTASPTPPGGRPGNSLLFLREQLLDANDCVLGILNATGDNGQSFQNREFGAAVCHAESSLSFLTSMVTRGVLVRDPNLRLVLFEAGFARAPPLAWRLYRIWHRLKAESPHLKRLPSEYLHDHVWLTTQPMEEPAHRTHVLDAIGWIGWDRLLFAADYPHWDYDDPAHVLPMPLAEERKRGFFLGNVVSLYMRT